MNAEDKPYISHTKEERTKMKLFVWKDVLYDSSSGMIIVMARTLEEAHAALRRGDVFEIECGPIRRSDKWMIDKIVEETKEKSPVVFEANQWTYIYGGA
jgi:hypothetical protein